MGFEISDIYRPVTGLPFRNSDKYREYAPCEALQPYVRCFWSSEEGENKVRKASLVIPDTCTDIIIYTDTERSVFCGLNDSPRLSYTEAGRRISVFAVRFYCHTAVLFTGCKMDSSLNCYLPGEEMFGKFAGELTAAVSREQDIPGRIRAAENFLLKRLDRGRENAGFMNALYYIISHRGDADISEISRYTAYSSRQLERIFKRCAGVSPRTLGGLIRYQLLWQDILSGRFEPGGAVEKFGYCDQSHMLNDFRRFHGLSPRNALSEAYRGVSL